MVPAGSAAAMSEVPPGFSGIGSGLFNASRQIGTSMGLAILGSVATSIILADWHRQVRSMSPALRAHANQIEADVAVGQIQGVTAVLGQHAREPAVTSFLHGFESALIAASVILVVAGVLGLTGLRHHCHPTPPIRDGKRRTAR